MKIGCRKTKDLLGDYIDKLLDASKVSLVDAHLANCPECRAAIVELRELDDVIASTMTSEPARDLWVDVKTRIARDRQAKHPRSTGPLFPRWAFAGTLALAAMLAFVLPVPMARLATDKQSGASVTSAVTDAGYGATYIAGHELLNLRQARLFDHASGVVLASLATNDAAGNQGHGAHH